MNILMTCIYWGARICGCYTRNQAIPFSLIVTGGYGNSRKPLSYSTPHAHTPHVSRESGIDRGILTKQDILSRGIPWFPDCSESKPVLSLSLSLSLSRSLHSPVSGSWWDIRKLSVQVSDVSIGISELHDVIRSECIFLSHKRHRDYI